MNFISKILKNPIESWLYLLALARGTTYIIRYNIFNKNVRISFPFIAFASVNITGPGSVSIGKGCYIYKNVFKGLSIVTQSSSAKVTVGEKCMLGGLTIRCRQKVIIGDRMMTAVSLIQDSLFVNSEHIYSRIDNILINKINPVSIGNNVWLGAMGIVLGGCRIGNDTVLSAGAWCLGTDIEDYRLVSGNPARKPLPIDKLLRLKGMA